MSKTTGHYLCQGGSSSKTAPAVVALGQRTGIQPVRPRSHYLLSTHVPKVHPTIDATSARRMIVLSNDDRWAETTQSLSNFGTGSYGGQHRGSEHLQKSTGVSLKLLCQIGAPKLVESRQYSCPGQKLSIGNSRKP